jgi:ZIP family zinc transporter
MSEFATMLLLTTLAGGCILAGGLGARIERIRPDWLENEFRHGIIAFGGGALISAVALVLVPEGVRLVSSAWGASFLLLLGGITFFALDRFLGARQKEAPQFVAMLADYLPESLALGGMFAIGAPTAPILAVLIGLQNLPEGFNAYRELNLRPGARPGRTLWLMCALIPLGPLVGTLGWLYAAEHTLFLGGVMLFASGGILYLLFQDIAPQSHLERQWAPALGAVLGFGVGMFGQLLVAGG